MRNSIGDVQARLVALDFKALEVQEPRSWSVGLEARAFFSSGLACGIPPAAFIA